MVSTLVLPLGVQISVGATLEEEARVLKAQFGSSQTMRAPDGLNTISGTFSLTFENLTREQSGEIVSFFRQQGGYKSFSFTLPDESAPRLWTCKKWNRTHGEHDRDTLSATFEEVFMP